MQELLNLSGKIVIVTGGGRGVGYVIILPNWFPGLAARDDVLEEVHRVALERNTIVGGETMVVYRADW